MPSSAPVVADLLPLLVPSPRSLRLTGGAARVQINPDTLGALRAGVISPASSGTASAGAAATAPGGYTLIISAAAPHVELRAASEAGLRAGRATLRQLLRQYGGVGAAEGRAPAGIPCLIIEDSPAFAHRGVMLDVSRDKVPTVATLNEFADAFAALKLNHLQLYTEHTFAYAGHDEVWLDASPITPDEARDFDAACQKRGILLVPNQNCFGHLHKWLKLHRYAHLAETQGDWVFMGWPRSGPFSLFPGDPGSIALVRDMLAQLAPCFSSPMLNVGCDETFDIGQGRSREEVERRGGKEGEGGAGVYFDFVQQICAATREVGKRPMLWADIALSHPHMLDQFPKDAVGLAWGYEPDSDFTEWCRRLADHGVEPWVCPGTSSWRSITGRTPERRANIANAAAARSAGAVGYLITDWGDMGHHQHWPIALNAIAEAAQAAWNPSVPVDPRAVALHVFGDESLSLATWLDTLGSVDAHIRAVAGGKTPQDVVPIRNASAMFRDLHRADPLPDPIPAPVEAWEEAAANLSACEASVPATLSPDTLIGREIAHTLATSRLAIEHALATRRPTSGDVRRWIHDLSKQVHHDFVELWHERNRPGGLARSAWHYQRVADRIGRELVS